MHNFELITSLYEIIMLSLCHLNSYQGFLYQNLNSARIYSHSSMLVIVLLINLFYFIYCQFIFYHFQERPYISDSIFFYLLFITGINLFNLFITGFRNLLS